jgi:hypothetical protein
LVELRRTPWLACGAIAAALAPCIACSDSKDEITCGQGTTRSGNACVVAGDASTAPVDG